jgi:hypothetical protein
VHTPECVTELGRNTLHSGFVWSTRQHIVACMCDSRRGFELDTGFVDHLQVVTTNNYSTVANSHTLLTTTAHAKFFQPTVSSLVVSQYRLLSVGILQLHRPSLLFTESLTTDSLLTVD